jgi:hypothetical protein
MRPCNHLMMASALLLVGPAAPQVQLLGMEHNPDIMLLAARCLTFMADVMPTSCSSIVRHGAVQVGGGTAAGRASRRP